MTYLARFLVFLLTFTALHAASLSPFTSDGCSIFPDGTVKQNSLWLSCCIDHDHAYWMGGTEQERLQADNELKQCVAKLGEPDIADIMLKGVRIGGSPYLPTSFRWGYGWSPNRGYTPLGDAEKAQVDALKETVPSTMVVMNDAEALQNTRKALRDILDYIRVHPDTFPAKPLSEKRATTREQRLTIWKTWQAFLDRMMVLDTLQRRYPVQSITVPQSTSSIGYAAFLAQYRYAMDFIAVMENDPAMHTTLNEEVPELGLEKGQYSALKFRFLNVLKGIDFALLNLERHFDDDVIYPLIAKGIEEDRKSIWAKGAYEGPKATAKNAIKIIQESTLALIFPVQKEVSEWMGDDKVLRTAHSLIHPEQIADIHALLQPGDILLERREWYLSNIGLPGYWPHAALYIGTEQERKIFFSTLDDPRFGNDFNSYLEHRYPGPYNQSQQPHEGTHLPRVIEAISEGVSFTTLEHSVSADSIAILRPRLTKARIAEAITRAFHYSGRPYDFDFDFLTDAKLVCTELVSKVYEGNSGLHFPLQEIVGRKVTTANDMAQLFDEEYGRSDQQLDLIAFYDGHEWQDLALRSDTQAFRDSWKRSKWFIWVQEKAPEPNRYVSKSKEK